MIEIPFVFLIPLAFALFAYTSWVAAWAATVGVEAERLRASHQQDRTTTEVELIEKQMQCIAINVQRLCQEWGVVFWHPVEIGRQKLEFWESNVDIDDIFWGGSGQKPLGGKSFQKHCGFAQNRH